MHFHISRRHSITRFRQLVSSVAWSGLTKFKGYVCTALNMREYRFFTDKYSPVSGQNRWFCLYTEEHGSVKTRILAYFYYVSIYFKSSFCSWQFKYYNFSWRHAMPKQHETRNIFHWITWEIKSCTGIWQVDVIWQKQILSQKFNKKMWPWN